LRYERDGYSVRSAKKKRRALPPDHWSLNEPPQPVGCEFFYEAYRDLSTCRQTDGPIPWDRTMDYAERKRLAPDVANALWSVISRMDVTERRWRVEQIKAESGGS